MASPAVPDPNTMPLADLKAAVNAPPPDPAPTPAPTPAAAPVPSPAPAPAPAPEPYKFEKQADGTFYVKLDTGEEFRGTAEEVLPKMAKSKYDSSAYAKTLKQELETTKAKVAQPPIPPTPPPTTPTPQEMEEIQTRKWMAEQLSKDPALAKLVIASALEIPPEQLDARLGSVMQSSTDWQLNNTWIAFHQSCPDFVDTKENCDTLVSYLPQSVGQIPTVEELKRAHALALYDRKYQPAATPATPTGQPVKPPTPPPMPSGGAGTPPGEVDPYRIPMDQLKQQINSGR